jgi:hypothetical protein
MLSGQWSEVLNTFDLKNRSRVTFNTQQGPFIQPEELDCFGSSNALMGQKRDTPVSSIYHARNLHLEHWRIS